MRTIALVKSLIGSEPRNGGNGYAVTIRLGTGHSRGSIPGPPKPRVTIGRTCASRRSLRRTTSPMISTIVSVSTGSASPSERAERVIRAM